jgi:hypothetical protein
MRLDGWGFVLGVEASVWIPGTFFRRKNDALASRRDGTIVARHPAAAGLPGIGAKRRTVP